MIKFLILVTFLILGFVSCGCISSQQPIMAANSSINTTTPTYATPSPTAAVAVQSNPVTASPTLSPEKASYEKGVSLYDQKQYQEAIDAFNTTISLNATNGDAYLARGKAFYQIGRMKTYEVRGDEELDQAINDFTQALTYGVNSDEILTLRGWSYYWKGVNIYMRHLNGKYAKASFPLCELAATDFSRVILDNPDNVDALTGRAMANSRIGRGSTEPEYQYDSQKLELAQKDAQRAYNLDPKNPWTNFALWQVASAEKQPPEIQIKELDKAILYDPGEAWFYFQRGSVKRSLHDDEGSFNDFNKSIELQPRFVYSYECYADWYRLKEKHDEVLVATQKALEINPNLGLCWNNFAHAQYEFLSPLTATGLGECIKSIDRAIAMDPESALYHWNRYWYLTTADRWDEAREELKIFQSLAFTNEDKQMAEREEINLANYPQYKSGLIHY